MECVVSKNLAKSFPNGIEAVRNLSCTLELGKIHVIVGPNGAGKTTFLRMVSTEISPSRGELAVMGYNVKTEKMAIKRNIGVMPQESVLYKQLTVWEHTYYFTILKGVKREESAKETENVLRLLGIYERRNDEINTLSGGMMQCVNLAQAVTGSPQLLILDEPTTGLDPEKRRRIWEYIKEFAEERTVLLTTQYLDEAQKLADRVLIFNKGKLVMEGNTQEVIGKVGYELKIELPCDGSVRHIIGGMKGVITREEKEKIILWAKDGKKTLQYLYSTDIDASSIKIFPPTLEEAYLSITGGGSAH